MVVIVN